MRFRLPGVLVCVLALRTASAGVVFEPVPEGPSGEVWALASAGNDVAALVGPHGGRRVELREAGVWRPVAVPGGAFVRSLDLSPERLAVLLESCTPGATNSLDIRVLDRRTGHWETLPPPPSGNACEVGFPIALFGEEVFLRTWTRNLLRFAGGRWDVPEGTPESGYVWGRGFVLDQGRLIVLGAPAFEYAGGRAVALPQPFSSGMIGAAVVDGGVALQAIGPDYSSTLHLPGDARRYAVPPVAQDGIFTWRGSLWVRGWLGLFERSEGRWVLSRALEEGGALCHAKTEEGELLLGTRTGVARAVVRVTRFVPVAVRSRGPDGRRFSTALLLGNFGPDSVRADVTFRPAAGLVAGTRSRTLELAPGTEARVDDLISWLEEEGGALVSGGADVLGSLRVDFEGCRKDGESWAAAEVRADGPGGAFSTFVPAPLAGTSLGWGTVPTRGAVLVAREGKRTNLGWCDAGNGGDGNPLETPFLWMRLGALGAEFHEFYTVGGEWGQVPVGQLFPAAAAGDLFTLEGPRDDCWLCGGPSTRSPRDLFGWLVDVDSRTGDGAFSLLATVEHDLDRIGLFFPAFVRARGAGGVIWSTVAQVARAQTGRYGNQVRFTFRGLIGGVPRYVTWKQSVGRGYPARFVDVGEVIRQAGLEDRGQEVDGTLLVDTESDLQDGLHGEARISGRRPDGSGGLGARLEGTSEGSWARRSAVVPGLTEGRGKRSNLVLANAQRPGGPAATLTVEIRRSADGTLLGQLERWLQPGERAQLNRVLREVAPAPDRLDAYAVVRAREGDGRFVAYGVVHDDGSGDGAERPMTRVE